MGRCGEPVGRGRAVLKPRMDKVPSCHLYWGSMVPGTWNGGIVMGGVIFRRFTGMGEPRRGCGRARRDLDEF